MKAPLVVIIAAAFLAHGAQSVAAQSIVPEPVPQPNPEDIKHGAVLCAWKLYLTAAEIATACHAGQDRQFQSQLASSIRATDDFIMKNGKVGPDYIAFWKRRGHEEFVRLGVKCPIPRSEDWYSAFRQLGVEGLKKQTFDLLSAPRTPVVNPCV